MPKAPPLIMWITPPLRSSYIKPLSNCRCVKNDKYEVWALWRVSIGDLPNSQICRSGIAVSVVTHLIYVICKSAGQAVTYEPVTAPKLCRSGLRKLCQISYSDPISAGLGGRGGPITKLRQTKNVPGNILSAPYFPPSNRRNHRGRLGTWGKMKTNQVTEKNISFLEFVSHLFKNNKNVHNFGHQLSSIPIVAKKLKHQISMETWLLPRNTCSRLKSIYYEYIYIYKISRGMFNYNLFVLTGAVYVITPYHSAHPTMSHHKRNSKLLQQYQ